MQQVCSSCYVKCGYESKDPRQTSIRANNLGKTGG